MDRAVAETEKKDKNGARLALLLALTAGFTLRLFHLGAESLWYDETVSVHLARQPIGAMIAQTAGDIHPPGYYFLLHLWQQISTPTLLHGLEYLYAFPSVIAGMLVLALLYAIGRRLFNGQIAVTAVGLAAISPFQIWYSQEVRMYTIGAALALFCLWALLAYERGRRPVRWLVFYALAAAAGLYTLYYFAFWLMALNVAALLLLWMPATGRGRRLIQWFIAQGAAIVVYAPWLPIVMRQVTDPPVPPWRAPWETAGAFAASSEEALAALLVGQSPPGQAYWIWAIPVLALVTGFVWWAWGGRGLHRRTASASVVLLLLFVPIGLLFAVTIFVTPIYHVRYIYLYATIFLLIPATLLVAMWRRWRMLAGTAMLLLLTVEVWALSEFWGNPLYRADDHRGTVAELAAKWRPGDAILANAGWIYPIFTTYWPTELAGVDGSVPPPIASREPLDDYAQFTSEEPKLLNRPTVARSGSVDGSPSLGWGNADSDFFALPAKTTTGALDTLASAASRLWQYRLYDTVSDPDGIIRTWLDDNATLLAEHPIPGRDFGLVQLFALRGAAGAPPPVAAESVCFGGTICLDGYTQAASAAAGAPLYVATQWRALQGMSNLALSLRLYDSRGKLAAQSDGPFLPATSEWSAQMSWSQPLAVPIAASLKPGTYRSEVVVYEAETGTPLPPDSSQQAIDGQRWPLGLVEILPSEHSPELPPPIAAFDYIELVGVRLDRAQASPGDSVQMSAYWRPRPSTYRDTYQARIELRDGIGSTAQSWQFTLGGDDYPSGLWVEERPVKDAYELSLDGSLAPGNYAVTIAVQRASDGAPISAHRGWRLTGEVEAGELMVESN